MIRPGCHVESRCGTIDRFRWPFRMWQEHNGMKHFPTQQTYVMVRKAKAEWNVSDFSSGLLISLDRLLFSVVLTLDLATFSNISLLQIGLLTKLYELCEGEIIVDGRSIAYYDRQTIRKVSDAT